jgi:hypothetical protein
MGAGSRPRERWAFVATALAIVGVVTMVLVITLGALAPFEPVTPSSPTTTSIEPPTTIDWSGLEPGGP